MMQFAQEFPEFKIVSAVSTQLSWSHIIEILPLKDDLQREFYLTLAASQIMPVEMAQIPSRQIVPIQSAQIQLAAIVPIRLAQIAFF
jgi:hypothetical protein